MRRFAGGRGGGGPGGWLCSLRNRLCSFWRHITSEEGSLSCSCGVDSERGQARQQLAGSGRRASILQ